MKKIFVPIIAFLTLFFSCKTLQEEFSLKTNLDRIELGNVGEQKKDALNNSYQVFGVPTYKEKIKVSLSIKEFNKTNYNRYFKSIYKNKENSQVTYVDSLPKKPFYLELKVMDKVALINAIHNDKGVFNYLKTSSNSSIVSKLRFVPSTKDFAKIKSADTYYLQTATEKQPYLILFKDGVYSDKINLSKVQTFGYDLSYFCWQSYHSKLSIIQLSDTKQGCANNSNRNPVQLSKRDERHKIKF